MVNGYASSGSSSEQEPEIEASKRIVDNSKTTDKIVGPSKHKLKTYIKANKKHLPYIIFVVLVAAIGGRLLWASHAEETGINLDTSTAGIDTSSQDTVNSAYWSLWDPAMNTTAGWTGSVKGCSAGTMTTTARNAEVDAINFVRRLQHLAPVRASNGVANSTAMKSALIVEANGAPNHNPPSSGPGSTCVRSNSAGATASAQSNLGIQYEPSTPDSTPVGIFVEGYLDEKIPPAENKTLGHRRRLSYPDANVFGIGTTDHASAIRVIGLSASASNPSPDVAWPTGGYFPAQLAPHTWSLTASRTTADFSAATVKVTHNGNVVRGINSYVTDPRYGPLPTFAWSMPFGYEKNGGYIVTVSNIKGDGATRISYKVRFFDPVKP